MKKKLNVFCSLLLALSMILPMAVMPVFAEDDKAYTAPDSPAVTYNMNVDWKFKKASGTVYPLASAKESVKDANGKEFYAVDYDDSDWETVSVPHPINAEDSFDGNCYDAGETGLYRGFMFYRKHITVPESDAGKKLFLEFEAVRQSVYLYVNGEIVGYYEAGISAMGFDITDKIKVGEDNVIAVATDNASDRGATFATKETLPGSVPGAADGYGYQWNTKDFNEVQGGITGNVNLYAKGSVYQTLPLYNNLKTRGNYIYATDFDIREKTAAITVEGEIRNESDAAKDVTLEVNVVDMDGNVAASFSSDKTSVAAAADKGVVYQSVVPADAYSENPAATNADTVAVTKVTASAKVSDLKFWSPNSPNLYDVYTILKNSDGSVIDVQKTTTGFRKVEYDIENGGLRINDQPVWLTGFAQRSTNEWAVIGVANDWLQDLDMQWIKEGNSNFIRWMHVAPKPSQIRSGDKYGVVSVCPAGDKEADVDGRAWDQRMEAMRDAMIYFRNSPSVLFWEAGNNAVTAAHQQEMTDMKNTLDPNGGRFSGCRTISSVEQINAAEFVGTMLNRHASGAKASMKTANKYMPIIETEYAREEAPRRVWDDFSPPDYDYDNLWLGAGASKTDGYDVHDLTSEDFAVVDVKAYNEFYSDRVGGSSGNDYYTAAGMMVWSDSNMHNRNTGSENCRTSGKVDPVRIKKEAFYALQAAQSSTPKIHIIGHWNYPQLSDDTYNYPEKKKTGVYWEKTGNILKRDPKHKTVYVIGSPDIAKMELYVNGTLVGTSTKPDSTFVYAFPNIDVTQSGEVSAKAYDARDQVVAEDNIKTAGDPVTLKLTPVAGPDGLIADGSDIAYFDVAVVDKDGNTCPLSYDKINMSLTGEGVLLGGYNSGLGSKITTNNKDFCYAECGTNRIFVRSTRKAGDVTLSVSLEGQAPVSATVSSKALELTNGLTTQMQRSFAQGEVPEVIVPEVDALKTLGQTFTADFSENGNTEVVTETEKPIDAYTMKVNGKAVTAYTYTPQPASNTQSIICDTAKTLDALNAAGAKIEYSVHSNGDIPEGYDGTWPMVSITGGLRAGVTQVDIMNGSTTLFVNNGAEKNLLNAQIEQKGDELVVDIAAVLGYLDGVTYNLDTENKVADITYGAPSAASVESADINMLADETEDAAVCLKITATYDDNGVLTGIVTETVAAEDVTEPVLEGNTKVMYWDSLTSMKPVGPAPEPTREPVEWNPQDVTPYDTLVAEHPCEESALTALSGENANHDVMEAATIEEGAPDGTKYLKTGAVGNEKYGSYCFQSEFTYGRNTTEDIMFALDVRFDQEGAGFTANSNSDSKVAGLVTLRNGTIQVQRSSSDYTDTKIAVDTSAWYHVAMVGRYSAPDANIDMYVWQYNGSDMEYVGNAVNIPLRNLSASNNAGASHLNVSPHTSVDNLRVYKLGADQLWIDSSDSSIKAGESMLFTYNATRANGYITSPAVTWAVYNEADDAVLDDPEITVSETGLLTVSGDVKSQIINVRVIANAGEEKEIYASKAIEVKAVDRSSDTYDEVTLSAEGDKTTVRVGEPLKIKAETKLNGAAVTPGEGDLIYLVCNEANLRETGNKNISITPDGTLSVTEDVLPQKITVRATNKSGSVSGTYAVEVLPANMNYGNEDKYSDTFASADACEEYGASALALEEGSWDGSGYYNVTAAYDFVGFPSDTSSDVIYSADMKFAKDGAGWTIFNGSKGKLGLQLSSSGEKLNAIGASNKVVGSMDIDKNAWYNIQVMCSTGGSNPYAVCMVYKYDENGIRVNPNTGTENIPYLLTVALRNLGESTANHMNISVGTCVDNVMNMYIAPDKLTLSVDAESVLAGGTVQASATASRKGIDFPTLNANLVKYEIYDANNEYPLGDDKITIDASGKISVDAMADPQDVYVRVLSASGGMSDSKKLTIKSSDIFEINKAGFDEDYKELKRLTVTKNFYYSDEVTFVMAVYDKDGNMKHVSTKKMYGDAITLGESNVVMNLEVPADFDKANDTMKIYAVTKLSTSKKTEGAEITVRARSGRLELTNLPMFDANSKVAVLILKQGANEENVRDEDILYFNVCDAEDITMKDSVPSIPGSFEAGAAVKVVGKVNKVHTIAVGTVQ